jgi:CHRD domain
MDTDNKKDITLLGVTGEYRSLALTATHIHQAARGASGPPRIALPNPLPVTDDPAIPRRATGCITGPFVTGIRNTTTGIDTGTGFNVKQIEDNPAGFFADAHTAKYVPGVVRGQFA